MKAMILAAGKGTRMRPLTYELPKPMIPILGKPVMEYMVEELSRHGIKKIMVNVSHLPLRIEHYFGDGRRWDVQMGYSFEGHIKENEIIAKPLGSAGGIKKIQQFSRFFDDTFVVLCGDALIDLDITAAIRKHWQTGAKASIVVKEVAHEQVSNYGVVICDDKTGQITSFQEKPSIKQAKSNLVNTGIYIFEPEVVDLIPENVEFDIASQLFPEILKNGLQFNAINIPFKWIDIGQLNDYWQATQRLMLGQLKDIKMPGNEVKPGIWVGMNVNIDWENITIKGPVYIGASSRIEKGCKILGPTWIGHGCYIKSNATISRSILFEHTHVGSNGQLSDAVVYGRRCADKYGNKIIDGDKDLDWVGDARESHYNDGNVIRFSN